MRSLRRAFAMLTFVVPALAGQAQGRGDTSESVTHADAADWWSLRLLIRPPLPQLGDAAAWVRNPIDSFVWAKLREQGLAPSPEADRRTLIRRLSFDLIGLPPTPDEVDAFVADTDPRAYEKLVDRLLESPHYGERWARHWLDVVHYGDTHGYDKDKPRPNAWPYRDYVIRAFNSDKPYGRFVQEQIAGDVLFPGTADGVEALGFIAAGPWDFIGHAEVPETKIDGKIARHLDRDDMVTNTIQTFNSLTIQCAQCHDHKFDPITQADYYSLHAVFAALDRADKEYFTDPVAWAEYARLKARQRSLADKKKSLDTKIAELGGKELEELDKQIAAAGKPADARPEFGYHSAIEPAPERTKWVQVDLGQSRTIERIVLAPCHDDFNNIGDGFGFPVRFKVEIADDGNFQPGATIVADHTQADFPNPGVTPLAVAIGGKSARYVRVTATKLALRQNDYIFALAELEVHAAAGSSLARDAQVAALDSIEAPVRWAKKNLVDGHYPGRAAGGDSLAALRERRRGLLDRVVDPTTRGDSESTARTLRDVDAELRKLPSPKLVYAGTVHFGSGTFAGTGSNGGKPRGIQVLNRGNVLKPGQEVGPGALHAVTDLPARFELSAEHHEGDRRMALARWLSDARNPLTWRSIVNRVWQYHIGRGIVETPNDFGRMGARPTHPELLDWLAVEFRDGGQSIKQLHRLIVTSATYRQIAGSALQSAVSGQQSAVSNLQSVTSAAQSIDSDNRYLWRMNRRKLEAEAVRDTVLFVSGKLDTTMYGPGFQDFVIDKPEHSPHYEYHLHDPDDPRSHRRSIYRFIVRSQQQPFMTTLDCADPSMRVDRRNESNSALQALTLLNNGFMVTMASHFATKLDRADGRLATKVERAFREALGRSPTPTETQALAAYARQHGLANACRLIFNLNEFAFVD